MSSDLEKYHPNERLQQQRVARQCVCCGGMVLKKSPAILMPFVAHRVFDWRPVTIDDAWGLQTVKNGAAYSICNSLYCDTCGFLFLDIRFSEYEMSLLYAGYREEEYVSLREFYEPGYRKRNEALALDAEYIRDVEVFLRPNLNFPIQMLDWGGDTGKNSPFKSECRCLYVYDISNKPVVDGAERIDKAAMYGLNYDLIVCSQVLEHIPYPAQLIAEISDAMSEDTLLYIELPCENLMRNAAEDKNVYLKKKHWHEHINFFSEASLLCLLQRCSMQVIKITQLQVLTGGCSAFIYQVLCKKIPATDHQAVESYIAAAV